MMRRCRPRSIADALAVSSVMPSQTAPAGQVSQPTPQPEAMAARTEAARGLVAGEPRRGGGAPREAVTLWHALHHLLRDQRTLRLESGGRSEEVSVDRLVAQDVEGAEREDRARRWPEAQHLRALTGANVRPRQAYLWLAAQTSLSLAGLHAKLFRRAGRWDLRDDDPPWSRDPSVSG